MFLIPGFRLLQKIISGESCQIVLVLVAHTLWALLNLSRGSSLEFGRCHFLVLSGEDVTSRFSPSDFRLPQNATIPKRSSNHCHICSTHSGSGTGSPGRVPTRFPEISVFSTCGEDAAISQPLRVGVSPVMACIGLGEISGGLLARFSGRASSPLL